MYPSLAFPSLSHDTNLLAFSEVQTKSERDDMKEETNLFKKKAKSSGLKMIGMHK